MIKRRRRDCGPLSREDRYVRELIGWDAETGDAVALQLQQITELTDTRDAQLMYDLRKGTGTPAEKLEARMSKARK